VLSDIHVRHALSVKCQGCTVGQQVDDSPEFLESAVGFLALQPAIQVVGRACSAQDALEQVPRLHPDLVLMDWAMPGMTGLEATRTLRTLPGSPRIIMLTIYDIPKYRAAARVAGADGFISKPDFVAQLPSLIRHLFSDSAAG
jgi:DNA-binding NarL/FixJ family response regulator